ncbi:hypothetical protein LH51_15070 [Nitrincola sp. A-D6]|nr:hypothetical protein LH51_15070 [Nitrincola sp. A-D6]
MAAGKKHPLVVKTFEDPHAVYIKSKAADTTRGFWVSIELISIASMCIRISKTYNYSEVMLYIGGDKA